MGSYMFFSPEMFLREKFVVRGEKTDIWALDITFFYLLTGFYPWKDATNPYHLKELIINLDINFDLIKNAEA
jgi:serine/threonine protein kinase